MAMYAIDHMNEQNNFSRPNQNKTSQAQGSFEGNSGFSFCGCCVRNREVKEVILEDQALMEDKPTLLLDLFPMHSVRGEGIPELESSLSASFLKSEKTSNLRFQVEPVLYPELPHEESKTVEAGADTEKKSSFSSEALPSSPEQKVEEPAPHPTVHSLMRTQVKSQNKLQKGTGRNKKFVPEEDEKLLELVKKYGEGCWLQIANEMPGRNRKQVRERYINFFKKQRSLQEFSKEEDDLILSLVNQHGRRWHLISDSFPTRTPIMIKNHYYTKLKGQKKSKPLLISSASESYPISAPSSTSSNNVESSSGASSPHSFSISHYQAQKSKIHQEPASLAELALPEKSIDNCIKQKQLLQEAFQKVSLRIMELKCLLEKQKTSLP